MDRQLENPTRRKRGIAAIVVLSIAIATVMQALGWAQTSYYSLTRALSHGTAQIDRYQWETRDESYTDGHFYSVKAPGLSILTLPVYESLKVLGAKDLSREMARNAHESGAFRWYRAGVPSGLYGHDLGRARVVRAQIETYTPFVWMLGLFATVLPAMLMMLLVRSCAERIEPGMGTAAAITLGAGTLVLPFATLLFAHMLSAMLAFACFALLWREREGPSSRLGLVAIAGLLAGFAVTCEYPLALAGLICGIYAISRGDESKNELRRPAAGQPSLQARLRRGAAYSAGVLIGVLPLMAYNLWAFGSLAHNSYSDAVAEWGVTGHDVIGMNDPGFFGIGAPSFHTAMDLLFSSKGLLAGSPVLAMALVGLVLLYRRERRAEALVIGGIFAAFLIYNSGYWLPFGGGSPGPRFLFPVLPFLAVPLAIAWRRFPATTLALAIPSVLTMVAATVTLPMIGNGDTGVWVHLIEVGNFQHTIVSAFGGDNGWKALSIFLVTFVGAIGLAVSATPRPTFSRDATLAAAAVIAWGVIATFTPKVPQIQTGGSHDFFPLVAIAGAASLLTVAIAVLLERRPWSARIAGETG